MTGTRVGFKLQCQAVGLPEPVPEYRFHPKRKWRFDWAFPSLSVAVEVEGGAWVGGRHTRGSGFVKDCEKYGEAFAMGWTVLRVTPQMMASGQAAEWLLAKIRHAGKAVEDVR